MNYWWNFIAQVKTVFRIFMIYKMLFSVLILAYTRKKILSFLWLFGLILAYTRKKSFFSSEKILFELIPVIPEKKNFFIEKLSLYPLIPEKNHFFWNFRKPCWLILALYSKKNPFFRPKKSFLGGGCEINFAMPEGFATVFKTNDFTKMFANYLLKE